MKKVEQNQVAGLVKKWLRLRNNLKEMNCPFAIFDEYLNEEEVDEDDAEYFRKTFCRGICKKYFPKNKKFNPCPCLHYSLDIVSKVAEKIIEDYSNVTVRAKTRSVR